MRIVYDDMFEFSQAVVRCDNTAQKGKCWWCPFYDRCQTDDLEQRHVLCGTIATGGKGEGE